MATKKFNPIRMTASTEEAAIEQALMLVGASREDVQTEVVQRDAKTVTVRISPRSEDEAPAAPASQTSAGATPLDEMPARTPETAENSSDLAAASQSAQAADAVEIFEPVTSETPTELPPLAQNTAEDVVLQSASNGQAADAPQDSRNEDDGTRKYSQEQQEAPETAATAISQEDKTRVLELARTVLQRMDLDAQVEIGAAPQGDNRGESRLYLDIDGEDVGILIGKHGHTLQAFQYILNVTANNGAQEPVRVTVDAGGYRARRAESLESMAQDAAARAQRDKRPVRLEPMPAHERRVVHMILERISGISTSSEGREPLRHVVVLPAGASPRGDFGGREGGYRGGGNGNRGGNRSGSRGFRGDR